MSADFFNPKSSVRHLTNQFIKWRDDDGYSYTVCSWSSFYSFSSVTVHSTASEMWELPSFFQLLHESPTGPTAVITVTHNNTGIPCPWPTFNLHDGIKSVDSSTVFTFSSQWRKILEVGTHYRDRVPETSFTSWSDTSNSSSSWIWSRSLEIIEYIYHFMYTVCPHLVSGLSQASICTTWNIPHLQISAAEPEVAHYHFCTLWDDHWISIH